MTIRPKKGSDNATRRSICAPKLTTRALGVKMIISGTAPIYRITPLRHIIPTVSHTLIQPVCFIFFSSFSPLAELINVETADLSP